MNVTRRKAEATLAAVKKQHRGWPGVDGPYGPKLVENWDWIGSPKRWAIVWEEGPYEWALYFGMGDYVDEEFGTTVKGAAIPKGVFAEAITSWSVGIYPA